jgi:hypothetical protein
LRAERKDFSVSLSLSPPLHPHLSRRRRSLFDFHAPDERRDDGAGAEVRAGSGGVGRLEERDIFLFFCFEVEVEVGFSRER